MLKKIMVLVSAALLFLLVLSACQQLDKEAMIEDGEGVYITSCARCHQIDGQGYDMFPALAGNPVVTLDNPVPMIEVVKHGRGSMPAFDASLNEKQMAAVLTYIRNAWGNEADPVAPKQVR